MLHGGEGAEVNGRPIDPRDYVRRLLEAYRATPGTSGAVHRADRLLAAQLHERGVALEAGAGNSRHPSFDLSSSSGRVIFRLASCHAG